VGAVVGAEDQTPSGDPEVARKRAARAGAEVGEPARPSRRAVGHPRLEGVGALRTGDDEQTIAERLEANAPDARREDRSGARRGAVRAPDLVAIDGPEREVRTRADDLHVVDPEFGQHTLEQPPRTRRRTVGRPQIALGRRAGGEQHERPGLPEGDRVARGRRAVEIGDQAGAGRRPVSRPQLAAVAGRPGGEHHHVPDRRAAAGCRAKGVSAREQVAERNGALGRAVGHPRLPAEVGSARGEDESPAPLEIADRPDLELRHGIGAGGGAVAPPQPGAVERAGVDEGRAEEGELGRHLVDRNPGQATARADVEEEPGARRPAVGDP
jgi:hypothetical protein